MKENSLTNFFLKNMFIVSKKPVLLKDLLEANVAFNEGMLVDPAKLNFKFLYGKSYIIFSIISIIILIPIIALSHLFFTLIDFHFSILATIIMTSLVFIGFDIFKAWARKRLTQKLIKQAWEIHFPYFSYEKYSQKAEEIYNEAIKNEIPKKELEQYVLSKMVK